MQYEIGHYYHAYNRGNNKQAIFFEEENYYYLIRLLRKNAKRFQVTIIAYCLMPNHYHLLVRQDDDIPLSKFIRSTFQSYAQAINNRFNRTGKLFENSRNPIEITDTSYLFHLCRYIHRNPLDAGLVPSLTNWPFSNYPEFIGQRKGGLYSSDLVAEWFSSPEEYQRFVESEEENYEPIGPYLFE